MIITGTVGVGKTHLAASIINEIIKPDNSVNAIYITFSDMIRHIRSAWRDRSVDEQSLITKYASASMLIIDEIGVQFGSDSEMVQMLNQLNQFQKSLTVMPCMSQKLNLHNSYFHKYKNYQMIDSCCI